MKTDSTPPSVAVPAMTAIQPLETLIVEDFGAYLGKHSERLRVSVKGEIKAEAPLLYLRQVLVKHRGVSVSSDAILACAERGIPIHFVSGAGGATLYTDGLTGTVLTRRAQLLAYTDWRALHVAGAMARAKIRNQATLLAYHARSRKQTDAAAAHELRLLADDVLDHEAELDELLQRLSQGLNKRKENKERGSDATDTIDTSDTSDTRLVRYPIDRYRNALLSIEGRAAQKYWAGVKLLVPQELAWEGRRGRGARDPFNSALNYGYAILARQVEQAIVLAGLDPFAGFLHADRPGKPSLTLDLIEEFRQPVVDRTLLGMVGKHMPITVRDDGMLDDDTRRSLATKIIERIEESAERYADGKAGGKRWALREIMQTQARHLVTYLRGERPAYEGFVSK